MTPSYSQNNPHLQSKRREENLVVIKQKDSDKSFEFTLGRLVLYMFVTKYCNSRFDCIGGCL